MKVRVTELKNGISVISDNMPHLESAFIGIWVKSGSRCENEDEHGISHMLEHMAFKGTKTRSAKQIVEEIENVGGDLNASTSIEHTGYFARILKDDVGLASDILADILQNSTFDEKEFSREQQVIEQEIGASHDDPDDLVHDLFLQVAYPDQAIGRPILGTVNSVKSFTPKAIRSYMDRNYVGDKMIVAAAGNINHDELVRKIEQSFSDIAISGAPKPKKATYVGGDKRHISKHEQAHVIIGMGGRAYNSDGFYATQILTEILGGGMSSRLFQEIREKRGLCYSVYAFHWAFADSGVFGVAADTGPELVGELMMVIIDELKRAVDDINDGEVMRVRNKIRAGLLMSLENPSARASQLARQQILWGRPIPMAETVERISKISAARVKEVAKDILENAVLSVAGVGPLENMPSYEAITKRLKA